MNDKIWENIPPWHHLYGIVVIYVKYITKQRCTIKKIKMESNNKTCMVRNSTGTKNSLFTELKIYTLEISM